MSLGAKLLTWTLGFVACAAIIYLLRLLWFTHPAVAMMLMLGLVIGWGALKWGQAR